MDEDRVVELPEAILAELKMLNQQQGIGPSMSPQVAAAIIAGPDAVIAANRKRAARRRTKTGSKT